MALGFVVARFGLFLNLLEATSRVPEASSLGPSVLLGTLLVLAGSGIIQGALHNHRIYVKLLPPEDLPKLAIPRLTSFLSLSVAAAGLLLAVYLALTLAFLLLPGSFPTSVFAVSANDGQLVPVSDVAGVFETATKAPEVGLVRLAEISAGRDSGLPQMVSDGSNFLLAWTGEAPDHGVHMISSPGTG